MDRRYCDTMRNTELLHRRIRRDDSKRSVTFGVCLQYKPLQRTCFNRRVLNALSRNVPNAVGESSEMLLLIIVCGRRRCGVDVPVVATRPSIYSKDSMRTHRAAGGGLG